MLLLTDFVVLHAQRCLVWSNDVRLGGTIKARICLTKMFPLCSNCQNPTRLAPKHHSLSIQRSIRHVLAPAWSLYSFLPIPVWLFQRKQSSSTQRNNQRACTITTTGSGIQSNTEMFQLQSPTQQTLNHSKLSKGSQLRVPFTQHRFI